MNLDTFEPSAREHGAVAVIAEDGYLDAYFATRVKATAFHFLCLADSADELVFTTPDVWTVRVRKARR